MLEIASEIQAALMAKKPVVALESTIIAHGFAYPDNLALGKKLEEIIRETGAIPATIALLDGKVRIGLSAGELERLASDSSIGKASVRDLALLMASGKSGATTVASTTRLAHLAGISVFATGGIGGVHRQAQTTGDVSADLWELAQTPMLVVSAGAKAILDLALTLEQLESLSIPVIGYRSTIFPAFYSRTSPFSLDQSVENAGQIAAIAQSHWGLGGKGILLANPIPGKDEIPAEEIDGFIEQALQEAERKNIRGKKVTPFLLQALHRLTEGKSQRANWALAENNARLAAEIAVALSDRYNQT